MGFKTRMAVNVMVMAVTAGALFTSCMDEEYDLSTITKSAEIGQSWSFPGGEATLVMDEMLSKYSDRNRSDFLIYTDDDGVVTLKFDTAFEIPNVSLLAKMTGVSAEMDTSFVFNYDMQKAMPEGCVLIPQAPTVTVESEGTNEADYELTLKSFNATGKTTAHNVVYNQKMLFPAGTAGSKMVIDDSKVDGSLSNSTLSKVIGDTSVKGYKISVGARILNTKTAPSPEQLTPENYENYLATYGLPNTWTSAEIMSALTTGDYSKLEMDKIKMRATMKVPVALSAGSMIAYTDTIKDMHISDFLDKDYITDATGVIRVTNGLPVSVKIVLAMLDVNGALTNDTTDAQYRFDVPAATDANNDGQADAGGESVKELKVKYNSTTITDLKKTKDMLVIIYAPVSGGGVKLMGSDKVNVKVWVYTDQGINLTKAMNK